jgi:flagellar capping protein FliD
MQITKIKNESEDITTNLTGKKERLREQYSHMSTFWTDLME